MRSSRNRTRKLKGPDADVRLEKVIAALRHAVARIEGAAAALTGRGQASASPIQAGWVVGRRCARNGQLERDSHDY
jgi:hypothetical protein